MKRFFILASAAIVALASCAKTEVVYKDAPEEIAFKQITNVMTKADVGFTGDDFGVFANVYGTYANYFENEKFVYKTTCWGGDQAQYWPIDGALDFAFYAPHDNTDALVDWTYSDTEAKLDITVDNSDLAAQVDWLYGGELLVNKSKADQPETGYPIVFKHILSKIGVTVKAESDGIVKVTSLKLKTTEQKETATVDYSVPATPSVSWSNTTSNEVDMTLLSVETPITTTGVVIPDFYVIPSAQQQFEIKYKVNDGPELTYTTTQLTGNWTASTYYTYVITVGLKEIKFAAKETDWTPSPAPGIEI